MQPLINQCNRAKCGPIISYFLCYLSWRLKLLSFLLSASCFLFYSCHIAMITFLVTPCNPLSLSLSFSCLFVLPSGLVTRLLSSPLWVPLSRISFQIYLVHFTVINFHFLTQKKPVPFTHYDRLFMSCGILLVSVGGALCTFCLFEAPFSCLVKKLIIERKVKKQNASIEIDELAAPAELDASSHSVRVITVLRVACWDNRTHDWGADLSHLCSWPDDSFIFRNKIHHFNIDNLSSISFTGHL